MKVIIYASGSDVLQQFEVCQNFADFYDYDVVGLATEINTLFNSRVNYDGVMITTHSRISTDRRIYEKIKQRLLKRGIIIITAVRS